MGETVGGKSPEVSRVLVQGSYGARITFLMNTEFYIPTVQWFHEELRNAGFSDEFLARYRFQDCFEILEYVFVSGYDLKYKT